MKNKRGAIEEGILTIYRLILVSLIAFFIFGVSAFAYNYHLDVRDTESILLARKIVNCFAPNGEVNLQELEKLKQSENFLEEYCNIKNTDRFYVKIKFQEKISETDYSDVFLQLEQGEDNFEWIKELYKNEEQTKNIIEYKPGVLEPFYASVFSENKKIAMYVMVTTKPEF